MPSLRGALFGGPKRQKQGSRPTGKRAKTLVPVKRNGLLVFRLDNQREGFGVAFKNAQSSIGEQDTAETLAMKALIDGEATDESRR